MENPIPIPSIQTLNPSVAGGRRHLASNTFSTLSRIFSHCLTHPTLKDSILLPPNPPSEDHSCNAVVEDLIVAGTGEKAAEAVEDGVDKELMDDLAADDEMLRSVEQLLNADVSEGELRDVDDIGLRLLLDEPQELEIQKIVVGEENVVGSPVRDEEFEDGEIEDEQQVLDDWDMEEQGGVKEGVSQEGDEDHILGTISEVDNVVNLGMLDETNKMREASQCLSPRVRDSYSKEVDVCSKGGLLEEVNEKLVIGNEEELSNVKTVENLAKKKKRGPLTEERKAKRKIVKKRKRAQKDREQGVKRLKLQPNVKPKLLKICDFYMDGRCQQGDLCKFSHDAIPRTKSQPCKYLACGSCMKGNDCVFDHELSKYPCHNHMYTAKCNRGDNCKFSHKISAAEALSASKIGVPSSPLPSEKRLDAKNTSIFGGGPLKSSCLATKDPPKGTTVNTPFPSTKHLETNSVKVQQKPLAMPKGICHFQFGKAPADSSNTQGKMQMEKSGSGKLNNQEKQGSIVDRLPVLHSEPNAPLVAQARPSMTPGGAFRRPARPVIGNKNPKNNSIGHIVAPFSKNHQSEASDSSKILDEFLFGAVI